MACPKSTATKIKECAAGCQSGMLPDRGAAGFLPLVEAGIVDLAHLIADAKSGVSARGARLRCIRCSPRLR